MGFWLVYPARYVSCWPTPAKMNASIIKPAKGSFTASSFILAGVGAVHLAVKGRQLVEQETEDEDLGSIGADQLGEEDASL